MDGVNFQANFIKSSVRSWAKFQTFQVLLFTSQYCVEWGVKLYSLTPPGLSEIFKTDGASTELKGRCENPEVSTCTTDVWTLLGATYMFNKVANIAWKWQFSWNKKDVWWLKLPHLKNLQDGRAYKINDLNDFDYSAEYTAIVILYQYYVHRMSWRHRGEGS